MYGDVSRLIDSNYSSIDSISSIINKFGFTDVFNLGKESTYNIKCGLSIRFISPSTMFS